MCPRYILSDNDSEFKNQLMDHILQQLGIDCIFSSPYHPQSNGKLEVFHKYLKPALMKLCEKDPANWDKYINQVLASYRLTPNLTTAEKPFSLVYGRDPNLSLHQLLEPMQWFLGDPESGLLNLDAHQLALAITKKTLDEKWSQTAQKTMDREPPSFKIGDRVYFKNKQPGKWDLKWRPGYRIVCIEYNRLYPHIENQATAKKRSCNIKDIVLEHLNHQWSSWTLTHNLAELGSTLTTLQIYQPSCSTTEDEHLTYVDSHLWIICTHLLCSIVCLVNLTEMTILKESLESVLFQLVLKAYPNHHSWVITAHVSLGYLEKQWGMFIKQMGRTQQLLNSLQQKPLAPTYMISAL